MKVVERLSTGFDNVGFFFRHDSSPEVVERARGVIVQNEEILQRWLDEELISRERLQEIENDEQLQQEYTRMMRFARDGGKRADETMQKVISFPVDKQAGWLVYFRKFHESRFNIDLLRDEKITPKD